MEHLYGSDNNSLLAPEMDSLSCDVVGPYHVHLFALGYTFFGIYPGDNRVADSNVPTRMFRQSVFQVDRGLLGKPYTRHRVISGRGPQRVT